MEAKWSSKGGCCGGGGTNESRECGRAAMTEAHLPIRHTDQQKGSSRFTSREGRKMVMMVLVGIVVTGC